MINILSSNRKNLENFWFLIAANFLAAALGWVTQVKIANTVGKEVFGQIAFGIVIGTYGQIFIRFGLDRTLERDLIHYPERFADMVRASLFLRYILTLISMLGLTLWNLLNPGSRLDWGMLFIIAALSMQSLDLQPVYDAWQKMRRHVTYFLIQKACYLLLIWMLVLLFPERLLLYWIGFAMMLAASLYHFMQHRWVMKRMASGESKQNDVAGAFWWLVQKNWLVWLAALGGLVVGMLNQPVLEHYAGYAELGGYAAAWQIMLVGNMFVSQVSRIGRPAMARYTHQEIPRDRLIRFLLKYSAMMTAVVIPLVLAMVLAPDYIFRKLFRPEYAIAANTLPILGWYLLFFSVGQVALQYVFCVRLEKIYFLSVVIAGIISICLCFTMIPRYLCIGAAWTLLISHGSSLMIYGAAMVKHVRKQA